MKTKYKVKVCVNILFTSQGYVGTVSKTLSMLNNNKTFRYNMDKYRYRMKIRLNEILINYLNHNLNYWKSTL